MHFRQLDLNLLVALDALLTERSITRAGKRLFLTQSAMSGALARLREYFGDELLVQVGRQMVPTPLAESLAAPVRKILMQIQQTLEARPVFEPTTSTRRFRILMSDYVASVLMVDAIRHLAQLAPHVQIELMSNDMEVPGDALERGEVDLMVMPENYLSPAHPSEPIFDDDYVCIASADHPDIGESLSLEQYLSLGHVMVHFNRGRNPSMDEWVVGRLGLTRRCEVVAMNFTSVAAFVAGTRRIATLQGRLATRLADGMPIKILPCPVAIPSLREAMQWHEQFERDAGLAWLRQELRAVADRMPRHSAA
jgi:DNA-binding transcriptional LysR family regulator